MLFRQNILGALRICLLTLMLGVVSSVSGAVVPKTIQVGGSLESLPNSSVTDAEIAFTLIFNEMLSEVHESFSVKIYEDNDTLVEKLQTGDIQAVFVSTLRYFQLSDMLHPTARYVVQYGPTLKQRYLVLVRNRDANKSLPEFRGGKLSFGAGHQVGKRFLDVELMQQGLPLCDDFFSEIEMVREVNTSVIDVFFGKVDVAIVPDFSYELALELNPTIGDSLSILAQSEPMVFQAVGVRRDFPQNRLDKIEPRILNQAPTGRLQRLLDTFRITRLHRINDDTLKEIRKLNERFEALTGQAP